MFDNLTEQERQISQIKRDYSLMLYETKEDQEKNFENLNVSLFNAQSYQEYLKINQELNNKELLLNEFKKNFKNSKKEFSKFCILSLKTKLEELSFSTKIDNSINFDISIDNWFKDKIKTISNELNNEVNQVSLEENSLKFSHIFQSSLSKIKKNKYYRESNCEEFFKNLETQILKAREFTILNFKINIKDSFYYFDMIFQKDIKNKSSSKKISIKKESEIIISELDNIEKNQEIGVVFDKFLMESLDMIEQIEKDSKILLKKYENNIEKLIQEEFLDKMKIKTVEMEKSVNDHIEKLNNRINNCKKKIVDIFKLGLKEEIDGGKYKNEIETICQFSFKEQFQIKICKYLGINKKNYSFHLVGNLIITLLLCVSTGGLFGLIGSGIYLFINAIIALFTNWFKTYEKIMLEKLHEFKRQYQDMSTKGRIKYYRLYLDLIKETKKKFLEILSVIYVDLSKIEEKRWIELNEEYKNIKKNLLSYFEVY